MEHSESSVQQSLLSPVHIDHAPDVSPVASRSPSPVSLASTQTRIGSRFGESRISVVFSKHAPSGVEIQSQSDNSRHGSRSIFQWWPEMTAAATSVLLLVATIATLHAIDGTPQDDWHKPWRIKPAAVVSTLITICQMSLTPVITEGISQLKWVYFEQRPQKLSDFETFDEASRGPWGAVCLIWRLKWRASVASIGAILVLLALAMNPIAQQILFTDQLTTNFTGVRATIGAAEVYNSGALQASIQLNSDSLDSQILLPNNSSGDIGNSSHTPSMTSASIGTSTTGPSILNAPVSYPEDETYAIADPPPKSGQRSRRSDVKEESAADDKSCADSSVLRAAYGGLFNANTTIDSTCPSGNCTWPSFTTLGICSSCVDISDDLSFECTGNVSSGQDCVYKLTDDTMVGNDTLEFHFKSTCGERTLSGTRWLSKCRLEPLRSPSAVLLDFYAFSEPQVYASAKSCAIPRPEAQHCTLSWCAKQFETSSFTNGVLVDEVTSVQSLAPAILDRSKCPTSRNVSSPASDGVEWQAFTTATDGCPAENDAVFWVNNADHTMTTSSFYMMLHQ